VTTYPDNDAVTTLVAAALFAPSATELLARATTLARSTTHRQLVAIASAHVAGDADRVRVLAADHAYDHPGDVLVAWMAAAATPPTETTKDPS
jgi:glutamate-1-semialdehyde aminotransferase